MIIIRTALCFVLFGTLGTSACREKLPCRECDDGIVADDGPSLPDLPLPDLPCGGADLMTDNLNCGSCGHECGLGYPGTEYEAGSCHEGVCGPGGWSSCIGESSDDLWTTCSDICIALGTTCVPNGCAGLTGMMFPVFFGNGCGEFPPVATISGSCDEPIPWMSDVEAPWHVQCCCVFQ